MKITNSFIRRRFNITGRTCCGFSCEQFLRSVRVFDSLRFWTTDTGCLKMDAVCRMGSTRLLSCLTPRVTASQLRKFNRSVKMTGKPLLANLGSSRTSLLSSFGFSCLTTEQSFPSGSRTWTSRSCRQVHVPTPPYCAPSCPTDYNTAQ